MLSSHTITEILFFLLTFVFLLHTGISEPSPGACRIWNLMAATYNSLEPADMEPEDLLPEWPFTYRQGGVLCVKWYWALTLLPVTGLP